LRSKILRGHHAALDFDKGIIVTSLKSGKDFDLKQEVEIGPRKKKRGRRTQKWDK
jgi:serine acetyltransferase